MIKKTFKNYLGSHFSSFNIPILVNSYGRSGSTVLTKSIVRSSIKYKYGNYNDIASRSIAQTAWDLNNDNLRNGIVYKTHDYPPRNNFHNKIKILYTFANPVDVVLSLLRLFDTKGEEWIKEHYFHLKVPYRNFDNIINEDQLKLEKHLDAWLGEARFNIAFIKYEKMWEHQEDISNFLNFEITLPPFRKRTAQKKPDKNLTENIKKNYGSLIEKFHKLDSFFELNANA